MAVYRVPELQALTADLEEDYRWQIGEYRRYGSIVTFVIGVPEPTLSDPLGKRNESLQEQGNRSAPVCGSAPH
jgi:hypothetical protein